MDWTRRDSFIVVSFVGLLSFQVCKFWGGYTIIAEDSSEVANYIDDKEYCPLFRSHGEVASFGITIHRVLYSCLNQKIIYPAWTSKIHIGCICRECKNENNDNQNDSMNYIRVSYVIDSD